MSSAEALRIQLDNLQRKVQELEVENAKLRDERPDTAQEIDADTQRQKQLEEATEEIAELRQRLHEAQENQVNFEEAINSLHSENDRRDLEFQKEIESLRGELSRVEQEHQSHVERLQMEAELQRYRSLEEHRRNWELKESEMRELLRAAQSSGRLLESLRYSDTDALSIESIPAAVISSQAGIEDTNLSRGVLMHVDGISEATQQLSPQPVTAVAEPNLWSGLVTSTNSSVSQSVTALIDPCGHTSLSGSMTSTTPTDVSPPVTTVIEHAYVSGLTASLNTSTISSPAITHQNEHTSMLGSMVSTFAVSHPVPAVAPLKTLMSGVTPNTNPLAAPLPVAVSVTASSSLPVSLVYTNMMNPLATEYTPSSSSYIPISSIRQPGPGFSRPSSTVVAQQLPPINKFSGEDLDKEGETFQDWIEQFEMIAQMCGWDHQAKLVNLTTRLRGQAYSFYRTCTARQRSDYDALKLQLKERFTPVRMQVVHSSLFHQRKQETNETVDQYAQDLRRLFYRAYPKVNQGSEEAEDFGRSVLAHQFVAGLSPTLRSKVAGNEGNFEQLLIKARFEEAKIRDLPTGRDGQQGRPTVRQQPSSPNSRMSSAGNRSMRQDMTERCYTCNKPGHFARNCPLKGRGVPVESRGRNPISSSQRLQRKEPVTANLQEEKAPTTLSKAQEEVAELRRKLQVAEVQESLAKVSATTHVLQTEQPINKEEGSPTLTAKVWVEGRPTQALLDTGSPVSIVSIDFLCQALIEIDKETKSKEERLKDVESKLKNPTISISKFGGGKVNILSQVTVDICRGSYQCRASVLVQKGSMLELLLGTDLLAKLGFDLVQSNLSGERSSLLGNPNPITTQSGITDSASPAEKEAEEVKPDDKSERESQNIKAGNQNVTVRLLRAVRIPARHSQLAQAKVEKDKDPHPMLFEAKMQSKEDQNIGVTTCVTEVGEDNKIVVSIENHGLQPVVLEEGYEIGQLEPIELVSDEAKACTLNATDEKPKQLELSKVSPRVKKLLDQLDCEETLTETESGKLQDLIVKFSDVFALEPSELGHTDVVQHTIDTGTHQPIRQLPYRAPFSLRKRTEELIESMLKQGVIKNSNSPWASPVVLVAKRDGSTRFCVDYRKLNSITKLDSYPLPRVDDSLDLLANTAYFSSLDLASGYWQVAMAPDAQQKTAFCSHSGHYEFQVMPFGLCNAPATFQRLMETVLAGLAREKCIVYLDDILVIGRCYEEHLENLGEVFERMRQFGLRLKPSKCHLAKREVTYLGYNVSVNGISADPNKIEAVKRFPAPTDVSTLRSFLGLASYYRRFVPGFSKVAEPLFALTRKNASFKWNEACCKAFEQLKTLLTSAPLLIFPNFGKAFHLETDASALGLGAVLAQQNEAGHVAPIAFASRTLQKHEKNYCSSELEALAVVWAVRHFRPYLYGHTCQLYTDHQALKSLMNTPHPSGKLARWGLAIQELDLHIHHRPGKTNRAADALSRLQTQILDSSKETKSNELVVQAKDGEETISQLTAENSDPTSNTKDPLAESQDADPELKLIKTYLHTGKLPEDDKKARELVLSKTEFEIQDGVLYHLERDKSLRIVVPTDSRKELFDDAHSGTFGAHLRGAKIHSQLGQHYWWPSMRADINSWARACAICASRQIGKPLHPCLTPLPVGGPFDRVGVDVVQLPISSKGNKCAVVFVDYLTKWPEVFPVKDQNSLTIARLLVEHIVPRHGVPSQLLSDRGPAFVSKIMFEVYNLLGIKKISTTAYHPQTDGLVERYNRTLIDMLSKKVQPTGKDWDTQLPYVLFAYRTSVHDSTKASPFSLLYGRNPRLPTTATLDAPVDRITLDLESYHSEVASRLSAAWDTARAAISKAQKHQKHHHDKRANDPKVSIGDSVFVYFPSKKSGRAYKFAKPFQGPYLVEKVFDNGVQLKRVGQPRAKSLRIALNRVRKCPKELANPMTDATEGVDLDPDENSVEAVSEEVVCPEPGSSMEESECEANPWSNRLRSRRRVEPTS